MRRQRFLLGSVPPGPAMRSRMMASMAERSTKKRMVGSTPTPRSGRGCNWVACPEGQSEPRGG